MAILKKRGETTLLLALAEGCWQWQPCRRRAVEPNPNIRPRSVLSLFVAVEIFRLAHLQQTPATQCHICFAVGLHLLCFAVFVANNPANRCRFEPQNTRFGGFRTIFFVRVYKSKRFRARKYTCKKGEFAVVDTRREMKKRCLAW